MLEKDPLAKEILGLVKSVKTGIKFRDIYAKTTIFGDVCEHDRAVDKALQWLRRHGKIHLKDRRNGWVPGRQRLSSRQALQ